MTEYKKSRVGVSRSSAGLVAGERTDRCFEQSDILNTFIILAGML